MARTYGDTDAATLAAAKKNLHEITARKTAITIHKMHDLIKASPSRLAFYTIATSLSSSPAISKNSSRLTSAQQEQFTLWMTEGRNKQPIGDYAAAAKAYQKAVQIDPGYAEAHFLLGQVYRRQGQLALAVRELTSATRLDLAGDRLDYLLNPILQDAEKRYGLPVIEISAAVENDRGGNPLMFNDPTHFSRLGMEAIAAITVDWMEKNGFTKPAQ